MKATDLSREASARSGASAKPKRGGRWRRITVQLQRLRNLTQPYFLDSNRASGYAFAGLQLCLLLLIAGLTLIMITGALNVMESVAPEMAAKAINDDTGMFGLMFSIWHSVGAVALPIVCIVGFGFFVLYRKALQDRRWVPWLFLSGIVFVLFFVNLLNTGIGYIARDLTNALVDRKKADVYRLLAIYGSAFVLALPIRSLQYYLTSKLGLMWRAWLSRRLIRSYMAHRAYYDVNPNDEEETEIDNPDQRIAEDTRAFTRESLRITVEAFDCLLTFVLNIAVLWSISHTLTWALFTYSGTASVLLVIASHKLVQINYDQLRYDADFRYGLVHIRDNAEAIAFYGGEGPETAEAERRLGNVVTNFSRLIRWEVLISVLRRSYGYSGYFFPYLFMVGSYLAGELQYGQFIQAQFAFGQVEQALSFVVFNIDDMAKWWAGISRLEGFQKSVDAINEAAEAEEADAEAGTAGGADLEEACTPLSRAKTGKPECGGIVLRNIRIRAPGSDHLLVDDLSLSLGTGQRVLVAGPSGCGKTSLLRVASGLWRPEAGQVDRPSIGQMLFVPQRPYMLLGSLREQLCYPLPQDSFDDESLRTVLRQVHLSHIATRYPDLGVKQDWPRLLSLGEQQRLAFARLLLNNPKYAVLDEATSALDVTTEQLLYGLLIESGTAVMSVGHRPSLRAFHDQVLQLTGDGGWHLMPAESYSFGDELGRATTI